jgi:hypothetical protein
MYARMMLPTAFFESSLITTARASCALKPNELRALKDNGPAATVKLPICEGILADLRVRSCPEGWSDEAKKFKAVYVGTMYGFETAGTVSQAVRTTAQGWTILLSWLKPRVRRGICWGVVWPRCDWWTRLRAAGRLWSVELGRSAPKGRSW